MRFESNQIEREANKKFACRTLRCAHWLLWPTVPACLPACACGCACVCVCMGVYGCALVSACGCVLCPASAAPHQHPAACGHLFYIQAFVPFLWLLSQPVTACPSPPSPDPLCVSVCVCVCMNDCVWSGVQVCQDIASSIGYNVKQTFCQGTRKLFPSFPEHCLPLPHSAARSQFFE